MISTKGCEDLDSNQTLKYILLACKEANLDKKQASLLYTELQQLIQTTPPEKAEKLGLDWYNSTEELNNRPVRLNFPKMNPIKFPPGYKSKMKKENEELIRKIQQYKNSFF